MAFDWASTALSVGGSLLGWMGGSKEGERDAKDAAALAQQRIDEASRNARANVQPFIETGTQANRLLAQYLGIDTSGYKARPTRESIAAQVRSDHFAKYGTDYGRNSDMGWVDKTVDRKYQSALREWEKGLAKWKEQNPDKMGDGSLLNPFTNEDFVKDPGYEFRMAEGNKGIDRAMLARGGFDSGAALKALNRYNQDFASNEFGNAYNRDMSNKQSIYNMLSGQSGQGLNAAQGAGNMAYNAATQIGNLGVNQANNSWQAQMNQSDNQANSIQSAIGNLVYGIRRGNQSVVGGGGYPTTTPPYNPSSSAKIDLSSYKPWG